jgi:hypothetical protein
MKNSKFEIQNPKHLARGTRAIEIMDMFNTSSRNPGLTHFEFSTLLL